MDRRKFFGLSVAAGGLLAAREVAAQSTGPAYNGVPRMEVQPKLRQQQQFPQHLQHLQSLQPKLLRP